MEVVCFISTPPPPKHAFWLLNHGISKICCLFLKLKKNPSKYTILDSFLLCPVLEGFGYLFCIFPRTSSIQTSSLLTRTWMCLSLLFPSISLKRLSSNVFILSWHKIDPKLRERSVFNLIWDALNRFFLSGEIRPQGGRKSIELISNRERSEQDKVPLNPSVHHGAHVFQNLWWSMRSRCPASRSLVFWVLARFPRPGFHPRLPDAVASRGEMHSDDVSWGRGDRRSRVGGEELLWETDVVPFGGYGDRQLRCRSQMGFLLPRGSGACWGWTRLGCIERRDPLLGTRAELLGRVLAKSPLLPNYSLKRRECGSMYGFIHDSSIRVWV